MAKEKGSTNCGDIHTMEYAPKYKGTNQRAATWMSLKNTQSERRPHTRLHTVQLLHEVLD